ncbi:MAG: HD family phosphohydrolase [Geitlerinemataceae cyanobacterium]
MKTGHDRPQRDRLGSLKQGWQNVERRIRFGGRTAASNTSRRFGCNELSLVLATVSLTGAIGQRFYNQPELSVGSIAPYTIDARESARVENPAATEERQRNARRGADPVLVSDPELTTEIYRQFDREVERFSALRSTAGSFPYLKSNVLPNGVQAFLRQSPEGVWNALLRDFDLAPEDFELNDPEFADPPVTLLETDRPTATRPTTVPSTQTLEIDRARRALESHREETSAAEFARTLEAIARFRQRYREALAEAASLTVESSPFVPGMFEMTDLEWQKLLRRSRQTIVQIATQGVPSGLPRETIGNAAKLQLSSFNLTTTARELGQEWIVQAVQPNLTIDPEQSRERAELAAQEIEPVFVTVEEGEIIVRAGEEIGPEQFILLDHFNTVRRSLVNWPGLLGFGGSVTVVLLAFGAIERRSRAKLGLGDRLLLVSISLSAPLLVSLGAPTTGLAAIGLLAGSFYGAWLGTATVAGLTLLLPLGLNVELGLLASGAIGGLFGAALAERLRSREELALLGVGVGVVQGAGYAVATLIEILVAGSSGLVWSLLLGEAFLQGLWGVTSGILVLGLSPYLEHLFDVVTPIRLAELANPNRPLLKRLAAEAPGTFQHTLFVATLAEAAAKALSCNVELVRTGTLYHDIGKMHDPLGFVENQMGGANKHDAIDDPFISAQLIAKHVTEGLVMARKSRLPKAVQAFIPEHQGTMLIAYFYYQAKQNSSGREVREDDFRYLGPIPQSRETGIVMLADSCEAALRSLKDASYDEALNMVNKILRARWQDCQLVESGLQRSEMGKIAEIFVQVWQQYHHKRIAYPKAALSGTP